jgi:hypothetical protein
VKMRNDQYLKAGKEELEKEKFYQAVDHYSGKDIKQKNDVIVDEMLHKNEMKSQNA